MTQKLEDGRGADEKDCMLGTDGSGNAYPARVNSSGQLVIAAIYGENSTYDRMMTLPKYSTAYISSATTTTVKSGAGVLHSITLGETAAGTITIYNNTLGSGTVILVLKASIAEQTFLFDCDFSTGLTIVTAAASKLQVSYL